MTIRAHISRCAKPNKNLAIAASNPNLAVQDEDVGHLQGFPLFFWVLQISIWMLASEKTVL